MDVPQANPILDEELIRISIEPYQIHFEFSNTVLQIGGKFSVKSNSKHIIIDPENRSGEISILWKLIGRRAIKVDWNSEIVMEFEDKSLVKIMKSESFRGSILDKKEMMVEDF